MAIIRCKMCGGNLAIDENATVCECEYCGSKQTIPIVDDEKKITLYERANRLRFHSEFDKSAGIYEQIVGEFPEEAEAYWGILLCKYGIEYVDDPVTGKKVPTCHRSSFESIMDDTDFEMVMENADSLSRAVYREQAKEIEEIRKGIIEVSGKEQPYDIFICYKETDEDGERTIDSVLAQDVYEALIEKGYRVFFARITLEDKLGTEYEPYIFAAFNSAKVMLAFGTTYDYYHSVWVKNEWSRFLKLMTLDKSKHLIPCYKDIDAYDIPKEFAKLQAQDMGKVGAIQDLIRGVQKIIRTDESRDDERRVSVAEGASNVEPLLKRAFMFLEDGSFAEADKYCERVLDQDPENAKAYLGKLMAEFKRHRMDDFTILREPIDHSKNYQKVIRFGDENLTSALRGYNDQILKWNENEHNSRIYEEARSMMEEASTSKKYKEVAELFHKISGFRDADFLAKQCVEKAEEYEKKIVAIISAIKKEKCQENYVKAKARFSELTILMNRFDRLQEEAMEMQAKYDAITLQEESLLSQLRKLGIFAGKEKNRIREELAGLSIKEDVIAEQLKQNEQQRMGYSVETDLKRDIEKEKMILADLESQIEGENADDDNVLSFEDAFEIYSNDRNIALKVDALDFKVSMILALKGKRNTVLFGRYIQKEGGKPEPIEWQVLSREKERMLLISAKCIDCMSYSRALALGTWDRSWLREWLNDSFFREAFTEEERNMISKVTISPDKKANDIINQGKSTEDQVFCLSISEAKKYFPSDESRKSQGTSYCFTQGALEGKDKCCRWWLRSPVSSSHVANVDSSGDIREQGSFSTLSFCTVRPALWVDLSKI